MRKLGLDFGTKTCGIAISDSLNKQASGLCNFIYKDNNTMLVIQKIKQIVQDYSHQVDAFILGYPTYPITNQKSEHTYKVESFAELLKKHFSNIEIILINENYSSQEADQYLQAFNIKSSQRKKIIDMISASMILQSYLNKIN